MPAAPDSTDARVADHLASIPDRIRSAYPHAPVGPDRLGRLRLLTTPPMQRATMTPQPWLPNPLRRLLRWTSTRLLGRRGLDVRPTPATTRTSLTPVKGRVHWHFHGLFRRLLLLGLTLVQTGYATYFMTAVLPYHGTHWLEILILAVFAILFFWISAGFWTALMGAWVCLWGGDRFAISNTAPPLNAPIDTGARTALVMPICNEDVARVFAGLRATYASLARTGRLPYFDIFLLSDSSNPDIRVAEVEAWLKLCEEVKGFGHVFYRRRHLRIKRKSGNIADFCRRWGNLYRYMVVLDADSVMSGETLVRLVQLMETNPGTGIIQTAPTSSGRETLFARIQQFANRVYGPLFTAGLHFWQLGESHYWGHNAIIRIAPFMRHCALGRLPGRGALAGEILSHDFVEAALMRRAGWAVWMAYDLPGSYEEMPPTLLEELRRDRRWCQGNLQNFRLFLAQGLHPAHRAVFMTGVMAYLSAPLWFLFLVLSTALLTVHTLVPPQYFHEPHQLFPVWPQWRPEWALSLFGATATLLFLPKVLAVLLLVLRRGGSRLYGGPGRTIASALGEALISALLAPIRMLFHTKFVLAALLGIAVRWQSPAREDAETTWGEALKHHGAGTVLGVLWAGGIYWLNPSFLWWLLPIAGSLILSIPLSVWSSRVSLGRRFRTQRLFAIPEETHPPRELRWTRAALRRSRGRAANFRRAVTDPVTNAVMCAAGRPRLPTAARDNSRRRFVANAVANGPDSLDEVQRNSLLNDPLGLAQLHNELCSASDASLKWH